MTGNGQEQPGHWLTLQSAGSGSSWGAPVTWREFADEVRKLAAGFIAVGVRPGDRVALMSRTRYEWTLLD